MIPYGTLRPSQEWHPPAPTTSGLEDDAIRSRSITGCVVSRPDDGLLQTLFGEPELEVLRSDDAACKGHGLGLVLLEVPGVAGPALLRAHELGSIGERFRRKADYLALDLACRQHNER